MILVPHPSCCGHSANHALSRHSGQRSWSLAHRAVGANPALSRHSGQRSWFLTQHAVGANPALSRHSGQRSWFLTHHAVGAKPALSRHSGQHQGQACPVAQGIGQNGFGSMLASSPVDWGPQNSVSPQLLGLSPITGTLYTHLPQLTKRDGVRSTL